MTEADIAIVSWFFLLGSNILSLMSIWHTNKTINNIKETLDVLRTLERLEDLTRHVKYIDQWTKGMNVTLHSGKIIDLGDKLCKNSD